LRCEDLTGKIFGRLKVLERIEDKIYQNGRKKPQWLCECQCVNKTIKQVLGERLRSGHSKSCGCLQRENASKYCKKTKKKYNTYNLLGEYGIGYTSDSEEFYFDLEDYDKIKGYCWYKNAQDYIETRIGDTKERLHRIVMNAQSKEEVDHISHIRWDDRKLNLRIVNDTQNAINKSLQKNNTSSVPGVLWHTRDNIWEAFIGVNNKRIYLGRFSEFKKAVKVRKEAEDTYFKEYSYDNSIKQSEEYILTK